MHGRTSHDVVKFSNARIARENRSGKIRRRTRTATRLVTLNRLSSANKPRAAAGLINLFHSRCFILRVSARRSPREIAHASKKSNRLLRSNTQVGHKNGVFSPEKKKLVIRFPRILIPRRTRDGRVEIATCWGRNGNRKE